MHLCFYSNKDKWSKVFLDELKTTNWMKEFQFVCVDTTQKSDLPKWLKQVPTLMIQGDENPVKTDTEVMNWLYERKMREMPKKAQPAQPAIGGEPMSYVGNEMKGFASGYSFIDADSSVNGNGGDTMPGTFSFLNGGAAPGDRTMQGMGAPQQNTGRTKKESMFDQQLDMYKQNRDAGMPRGPMRQ
jgi:hypothetical protein